MTRPSAPVLDTPADRRRLMLDIVRRRVRPGSGSGLDFLRRRDWREPTMALDFSALRTPFVVVGGVATALYMPLRMTLDVDLLVAEPSEKEMANELVSLGCQEIGPLAFGGHRWRTPDGSDLDVLVSNEPWASEAITSPNHSPSGLPVIDLPYLVLMKLDASRGQDVADVMRMLGGADESTRNRVRHVIRRYRPDQVEDVESIIALGELEFQ
jgi:hypothetical protein